MNEYFQIVLTAILTGMGTGMGAALGSYFATKGLIQNVEKLVDTIKTNGEKKSNE